MTLIVMVTVAILSNILMLQHYILAITKLNKWNSLLLLAITVVLVFYWKIDDSIECPLDSFFFK